MCKEQQEPEAQEKPDLRAPMVYDDVERLEVPVTIAGKRYVLREADGMSACRYRNAAMRATKFDPKGNTVSADGLANVEPFLVSMCLFEAETNKPVNIATIQGWPARVQSELFDRAKAISHLSSTEEENKKVEDEAKNVQGSSEDGLS